ncbi:hypothetical protein ACIPPM_00455 [Streptomyces sp. NPDC090119]|uniref:hypothetical protein n=1 Tax=Streptomyces sp. NPDC090119 TaxID=3365951 RepID=UPI0038203750
MNPDTYTRLYGAARPSHPARNGVTGLAVAVWALNGAALAWLTFVMAIMTVWGAAEGLAVGGLVLRYVLTVVGTAAALTALAFAPGVRRLSREGRWLLTGALVCPVVVGLAVGFWVEAG